MHDEKPPKPLSFCSLVHHRTLPPSHRAAIVTHHNFQGLSKQLIVTTSEALRLGSKAELDVRVSTSWTAATSTTAPTLHDSAKVESQELSTPTSVHALRLNMT